MIGATSPKLDEGAVAAWRERIRVTTFANYHFEMGRALERTGEREAAEAAYRRALDIMPEHGGAAALLTGLLSVAGDLDRAAAVDSVARQIDPDYWGVSIASLILEEMSRGNKEEAARLLGRATGALASLPPIRIGRAAFHAGTANMDGAAAELTSLSIEALACLERLPLDPCLVLLRRMSNFCKLSAAELLFAGLEKPAADNWDYWFARAVFAIRRQQPAVAMENLDRLSRVGWNPLAVSLSQSIVLLRLGQTEKARAILDRLLDATPDHLTTIAFLALVDLAEGQLATALERVIAVGERNEPDFWFAMVRIALLDQSGRSAEAADETATAVKRFGQALDLVIAEFPLPSIAARLRLLLERAGHRAAEWPPAT